MAVLRAIAEKYQLHPLAIEDMVHPLERPKVEDFPGSADQPGRLFVIARAIDERDGALHSDQVSLFLGRTTLLTFQDVHRQDLEPIRQRHPQPRARGSARATRASSCTPCSTASWTATTRCSSGYSERLSDLDEELLEHPTRGHAHSASTPSSASSS